MVTYLIMVLYHISKFTMATSKKVIKRASEFAVRFRDLWEKSGKPKLRYPTTPKIVTPDWNGDRLFRDEIMNLEMDDERKKATLACLDICIEEKESLLSDYKETTFIRSVVQEYRKAIAKVTDTDPKDYTQTPIAFFTPDRYALVKGNEESRKSLNKSRIPISPDLKDQLILKAIAIIEGRESRGSVGKDIYSKAVSLELLTGRRCFSEILSYADFRLCSDHEVVFTGQAKGNLEKREREYIIPVLGITPDQAVDGLKEIRNYIESRPWYTPDIDPSEIKRKTDSLVNQAIIHHYFPLFFSLWKSGYSFKLSSHSFRKLYATFCHQTLAPEKPYTQYIATILGHDYVSKTGQVLSRTETSQHYDMFYLTGT